MAEFVFCAPGNPQYTTEGAAEGPKAGFIQAKDQPRIPAILIMADPEALDMDALSAELLAMGVPQESVEAMVNGTPAGAIGVKS